MKLCVFSADTREPYGASKSLMALMRELDHLGDVSCSLFSVYPGRIGNLAESLGWATRMYDYTWHLRKTRIARLCGFAIQKLTCALKLISFIKRERVEVVYVNSCVYSLPILCGWLMRRPVVVHMRDSADYLRSGGIYRRARRMIFKRCARRFIAISEHARQDLLAAIGDVDVSVIHNGIDTDHFSPSISGREEARTRLKFDGWPHIVVCVTRIDPRKGIQDFLEVADKTRERFPDVLFLLVGGPVESEFFRLSVSPRLESASNVRHLPFQDDVRPLFSVADIVLNTTHGEQFGRTNVEAMAMGSCVLSSDAGAIPEIIVDGVTGFLFGVGVIDDLPARIGTLLDEPALRERVARAASADVRTRFGMAAHVAAVRSCVERAATAS